MWRGLGLAVLVVWIWACSRPAEPPRGALGLVFGDAPSADLAAVPVPLPDGVAGALKFYTRPGWDEAFLGVRLTEPVLAFYQGRFFSVSAALPGSDDGPGLRERLTRAYGPPYCRDTAELAVCLWRIADVDAVVEVPSNGPWRFMLRHRPLAELVAAAAGPGQATGLENTPERPGAPETAGTRRQ